MIKKFLDLGMQILVNKYFSKLDKKNKKITGYEATAKASIILNYCNMDNKIINFFVGTMPDKVGKFMLGSKILIKK